MINKVANSIYTWILLFLWVGANAALFGYTFWKYATWDQFYYLRKTVGYSVVFARASAAPLNLNLALILLPVCRNLLSLIRGSFQGCQRTALCRQLDRNIDFHKLCAYALCFFTAIHYFAHTFNFTWLIEAAASDPKHTLLGKLSALPISTNGSWFNPIRSNHTNGLYEVAKALPGYTGIIATILLVVIVSTATETIRRGFFEVFWYTHHFFIVFYIALIAHDWGGIGRTMTNFKGYNFEYCSERYEDWDKAWINDTVPCPSPQYKSRGGQTWLWVIGPVTLYLIERMVRLYRGLQRIDIVKVIEHPAQVLELQLRKKGFKMTAGQYILLNCSTISKLEWHPFTLTSAPEEDFFSVHIRLVGDWTQAVAEACKKAAGNLDAMPRFSVDGPYGTCSEDVFKYDVAVLIGAGIGVTPFASILKHIWYMHQKGEHPTLKRVYFLWTSPETHSFSWFLDLLKSLEQQVCSSDHPDFLDIHIYWTRGWTKDQMEVIVEAGEVETDTITGLRNKTNFGRPSWDIFFRNLCDKHPSDRVGVFFCGPPAMSNDLDAVSTRYSSSNPRGTRFVYNKENF